MPKPRRTKRMYCRTCDKLRTNCKCKKTNIFDW